MYRCRLALTLWSLIAVLSLGGCGPGPDHLSGLVAAFSRDGALHLAAEFQTGQDEGGGFAHIAYLYARREVDGAVTRFSPPVLGRRSEDDGIALVEGVAGEYLVFSAGNTLSLWLGRRDGWGWAEISMAALPSEARSGVGQRILAVWGEVQDLRVLTRQWLYTVEGDKATDAYAVKGDCFGSWLCYVAPELRSPGDSIEAIYWKRDADIQRSLVTCDAGKKSCMATDTGSSFGDPNPGGRSSRPGRFFFRTRDASGAPVPVFVRTLSVPGAKHYGVVATTPSGDLDLVRENAYFIGAAPLPAGGYVVAVESYDETLRVIAVGPDLKTKHVINLGRHRDGFMDGALAVLARGTTTTDQRAHIFYGAGRDIVRHLTVDLVKGSVEGDDLVGLQD